MDIVAHSPRVAYAFGRLRADDDAPNALTYEPLTGADEPHDAAIGLPPAGWDYDDLREWRAAEMADGRAGRGW